MFKIIFNEIGFRMEFEFVKVEEGMCDGCVLYYVYVKKIVEEVKIFE